MSLWLFGGISMRAGLKEKLENNIWITRKCRINASERLLKSAKFVEFLNVYYSIFVITLSLLSLIEKNDHFSFASTVLSIALTISIVYANATGLRDRSLALKNNYIDLQKLLDQLSYIEDTETEKILAISREYAELLKSTENHLNIDLYNVKISFSDKNFKMKGKEWAEYTFFVLRNYICKFSLIIAPIFGAIYLFFVG